MQAVFDAFGHIGYFLLLLSFSVSRLHILRILTICANCCVLAHFYLAYDEPKWIPIMWAVLYNIINVVQLIREKNMTNDVKADG